MVRALSVLMGFAAAFLMLESSALAETGTGADTTADESEVETDEESGPRQVDHRRLRRLRMRGIILTTIGLAFTGGGATMSAFGFDDQVDSGDAVMRPLSVIFLGIGLALTGVGVSDIITSFLEDDRSDGDVASFRLRPPTDMAWSSTRLTLRL